MIKKTSIIFTLILTTSTLHAQNKMRPVNELINKTDPGWVLVKEWIDKAKNQVKVLPCDMTKANDALYKTQVTTRSPMGAVIYQTGGILVDGGWIRILGSGSAGLNRSLPDWNKGKTFANWGEQAGFLLIADDIAGGFFAINGGVLGSDTGKIYYLAPDNLEWEALDLTYTDFLLFCFSNDLGKFYKNLRWKTWKADIAGLDGNRAFNFYPFLWTKEGKDINKVTRKDVPVEEIFSLEMDMRKQLGIK
ncbi:MAG: DUF2625 domain-containing protein [Bacteroidota bacterium]